MGKICFGSDCTVNMSCSYATAFMVNTELRHFIPDYYLKSHLKLIGTVYLKQFSTYFAVPKPDLE